MLIKNFLFKNPGIRFVALVLAVFVCDMISGKERTDWEKTFDINVEYFGVPQNIDVKSIRPDKVRVKVRATSQELSQVTEENFRIRIDLKDVTEGTHNFWTEYYLESPPKLKSKLEITSIQQKMIEITVKEFMTREVPVRVRYKGHLPNGILLLERRLVPEKVKILGYKSQIIDIQTVESLETVDLSDIESDTVITVHLKKEEGILKFEDKETVEVRITVNNTNKPKTGNAKQD